LLEPLRQAGREAREAAFLAGRLAADDLSPRRRRHLAVRRQRLTDPGLAARRREQAAARARRRLERSLALLRQESLERVLDGVDRSCLAGLLGRPLPPGPLPEGLREALHLLHADDIDQGVLVRFLDDVVRGRSLLGRPCNRNWLDRAAARGVRTDVWLRGFSATVEVAGERITFATERDPLRVLRMGTYFDTCLSLEGGCYAASTLVNALDVNKQVVHGRRPDGTVVARKLIGATARGELAGYNTYATADAGAVRRLLTGILIDFARRCNLRLGDTATPETLHDSFWYDDGNEAWQTPDRAAAALEHPPADAPQDEAAAAERALREALAAGDAGRLQALARDGPSPWREAALFRLLRDHPGILGNDGPAPHPPAGPGGRPPGAATGGPVRPRGALGGPAGRPAGAASPGAGLVAARPGGAACRPTPDRP
jgi:hypothetical protein